MFCIPHTCQNGGTCDDSGGFMITCSCADGYSGMICDQITLLVPLIFVSMEEHVLKILVQMSDVIVQWDLKEISVKLIFLSID